MGCSCYEFLTSQAWQVLHNSTSSCSIPFYPNAQRNPSGFQYRQGCLRIFCFCQSGLWRFCMGTDKQVKETKPLLQFKSYKYDLLIYSLTITDSCTNNSSLWVGLQQHVVFPSSSFPIPYSQKFTWVFSLSVWYLEFFSHSPKIPV